MERVTYITSCEDTLKNNDILHQMHEVKKIIKETVPLLYSRLIIIKVLRKNVQEPQSERLKKIIRKAQSTYNGTVPQLVHIGEADMRLFSGHAIFNGQHVTLVILGVPEDEWQYKDTVYDYVGGMKAGRHDDIHFAAESKIATALLVDILDTLKVLCLCSMDSAIKHTAIVSNYTQTSCTQLRECRKLHIMESNKLLIQHIPFEGHMVLLQYKNYPQCLYETMRRGNYMFKRRPIECKDSLINLANRLICQRVLRGVCSKHNIVDDVIHTVSLEQGIIAIEQKNIPKDISDMDNLQVITPTADTCPNEPSKTTTISENMKPQKVLVCVTWPMSKYICVGMFTICTSVSVNYLYRKQPLLTCSSLHTADFLTYPLSVTCVFKTLTETLSWVEDTCPTTRSCFLPSTKTYAIVEHIFNAYMQRTICVGGSSSDNRVTDFAVEQYVRRPAECSHCISSVLPESKKSYSLSVLQNNKLKTFLFNYITACYTPTLHETLNLGAVNMLYNMLCAI